MLPIFNYNVDVVAAVRDAIAHLSGRKRLASSREFRKNLRSGDERRVIAERRATLLEDEYAYIRRLRVGFLHNYFRLTRRGDRELLELRTVNLMKLKEAFREEMNSYQLHDKRNGKLVDCEKPLNEAINAVAANANLECKQYEVVGVLVDEAADYISRGYFITPVERRQFERRRSHCASAEVSDGCKDIYVGKAVVA
jgi:hypothetical protein